MRLLPALVCIAAVAGAVDCLPVVPRSRASSAHLTDRADSHASASERGDLVDSSGAVRQALLGMMQQDKTAQATAKPAVYAADSKSKSKSKSNSKSKSKSKQKGKKKAKGKSSGPLTPATANQGVSLGFNLSLVAERAAQMSQHSWEFGATSQMYLEVYNPGHAVFGQHAFPGGQLPALHSAPALDYATQHISNGTTGPLADGDGSSGDPCSLGVSALLLGAAGQQVYTQAAERQLGLLLSSPHYSDGTISSRASQLSLWADWAYMAPPFMAYAAVASSNETLMQETVNQLELYTKHLAYQDSVKRAPAAKGLWRHISGSSAASKGLWTTGEGWALNGMVRVLATLVHGYPTAPQWVAPLQTSVVHMLEQVIAPLLACTETCGSIDPSNGLLRGYLFGGPNGVRDTSATWAGEVAGTAGVVSALYRYAVLQSQLGTDVTQTYVTLADTLRQAVVQHVSSDGYVAPSMNPYDWNSPTYVSRSPEGQTFVALMGSAYRDCVRAKVCQ